MKHERNQFISRITTVRKVRGNDIRRFISLSVNKDTISIYYMNCIKMQVHLGKTVSRSADFVNRYGHSYNFRSHDKLHFYLRSRIKTKIPILIPTRF